MKKIIATMLIACMVFIGITASAVEPITIPEVPNAEGALIFDHNFENGEFDGLLPKGTGVKYIDENNTLYTYKTGSEPVIALVDGNGGKVLKFDGSGGSDTYTILLPETPLTDTMILSFDVMTDTIPATGRKEILKISETAVPANRVIDFLSDGGIYSNGARFAPYPNYEINKWYHFDVIMNYDKGQTITVQLTVDGRTYRQDYSRNATMTSLASMRFATKANFGSIYIDNLRLFKDVPSSYALDTDSGITLMNNTTENKEAVFVCVLYENEESGPRILEMYSEKVLMPASGSVGITQCDIVRPEDNDEKSYSLYYGLWDFGTSISILAEQAN